MAEGLVKALWRFPVLGMRGESLRSSQIDSRGVGGDRQHYARGQEGPLSAQDMPGLSRWQATFPFNPDSVMARDRPPPFPLLVGPGQKTWRWRDPRLFTALERDFGRPVDLVRDLQLTRGVIVSAAELQTPAEAGVNVLLELELPPAAGPVASSRSATACAFDSSPRARTGPGSRRAWSKAGALLSASRSS